MYCTKEDIVTTCGLFVGSHCRISEYYETCATRHHLGVSLHVDDQFMKGLRQQFGHDVIFPDLK